MAAIPVPASFLLNETATAVYNTIGGTTITQPDGIGGDIVITVAANTGVDIQPDPVYTLVGQYQMAQPTTDTILTATRPITFTQTYNDGTTTTVTGPTWTETLAGDQETGNTIEMNLTPTGNSSASSSELVLNGNTADDPETVSSIGFTLNDDQAQTGTFVLTVPDGMDATSITTPKSGIMAPVPYKTAGYYLPGTTSYAYTLTLADGTVETGTVAAGDTITPAGTAAILKAEFTPNTLVPGAYTTGDNNFRIHGHLMSTYADGQAVKNGDVLKFVYDYVAQFANGVTETTTTDLTETIVSEKGLAMAWDHEYGTAPGGTGVLRLQGNGYSNQTTDSIYEPILYFVIPKNTTITGYHIPDGQHPVITQYTTADGRTGAKMDFTGTGESIDTSIGTLDNLGVDLINSLDAVTSTSAAESYITSPTTALMNATKVTDASLTDGDTNAVQMTGNSSFTWTVTTANYIGAVTMAQGNQDADLSATGNADERGDETLTYTYTMVNGSGATATNTSVVLNLPTTDDALGSTFTYDLTGPVSVPTTYSMSGDPLTATILYSKQAYTTTNSATAADLANFVTAAEIGNDWASVRAVYVNFNAIPAQDTTGRVTLTGTAEQFIAQGTHVGYLNSFTFYNGSPVSEATTESAAKIAINGTSTVTARVYYTDLNGDDQYVNLDDLTRTLTDNQDTLDADYPTVISDFSEADQALLPVGYSLTGTTVINSKATYANGMANGTAVIGATSQYDFDGDMVQFELTRDQPTTATNVITKVVHYVDENGTAVADDYVAAVTITQITDKAAGTVIYEPTQDTLGHQANPTIQGYTIKTSPEAATSDQTVTFGSDSIDITVTYMKDKTVEDTEIITKTVHYELADGTKIADDYTASATLQKSTDTVTDVVTYLPETAILAGNPNPEIVGYHVVTLDTTEATAAQTLKYGDHDIETTIIYEKNPPAVESQTITKTVHYELADGTKLADDATVNVVLQKITDAATGVVSYQPETATLIGQPNAVINGYHVAKESTEATAAQTVKYGDADLETIVIYAKDTPQMNLDTVTKTVHYVDQDGQAIAPDYSSHANITEVIDPVTGEKTHGPAASTVGGQANPTVTGYHVVTNPAGATSSETVGFGDADLEYTVVYNKNTPQMNLDTVTKAVHYVDQDGNAIAPDYISHANITEIIDPVMGEKASGPAASKVDGQVNPTVTGYHVVTNPAGATSSETVGFGDADLEYTVVYNKDTPQMSLDTVTKTVHYVDQDGNTTAPDYTSYANITEVIDPVTGGKTYGPATSKVNGQANPTLTGYHVVTNPTGATSSETVEFGDSDLEYTVVYNKNTPQINLDTVTKTVHYVDQNGNTIAPDYTSHANITEVTDPVTRDKTYGPAASTVAGQANPTITGYHVVTNPAGATTDETVEFGDTDLEYTVMYNKNTPQMNLDAVTKTVHYVDQDGNAIAPDYTSHANITEIIDPVTGDKTYGPATSTVSGQANPTIAGYYVVTNPAGATTDETVEFGDTDLEYTVMYNKNTPTMNLDTVTKTIHYADQDGNTIVPDYTSHANITEIIDPVTGEKTYGPATSTVDGQANPTITGYHAVTSPAGATTAETVEFGDSDLEYTVVYSKDTPQMNLDTVTKTIHYVDQDGNTIAPDYTSHANITEIIDPVTGEKTYGPATSTVGGQANPTIAGYHVVTDPAGATTSETVAFGDADLDYTVIYAANPDTDDNGTPDHNGGTTTPDNNGGTTTPGNNGGTTTPDNNGGTTTPGNNGDTTTPDNNGGTTTPGNNDGTTTPDNNNGITMPDNNDDTATPGRPSTTSTVTSKTGTSTVMPTVATLSDTAATSSSNHHVIASNTATKAATTLPQTGEDTQSQLALLGASMLALLGFVGYRRKRD